MFQSEDQHGGLSAANAACAADRPLKAAFQTIA